MKPSLIKIKNQINENLDFLKSKYHVREIGVFGSVARGEDLKSSDVDLLVEFSQPVGMFTFVDLENHLSQVLGKKVDLVTKKALKSAIRDDILKEVIYV